MKIAIVTGASSGMGREAVLQIAERFPKLEEIWVVARRVDRLESLQGSVPVLLRMFPLDLKSEQSIEVLREHLEREQPEVKILVNSAGYGKNGPVSSHALFDETGMVRINCEALCGVTHIVLPYMSKNSRVIQMASSAGFLPQPDFAVYAASKAFVLSYSRALHAELRDRRIAVTAVCPGPVRTEFFDVAQTGTKTPFYKTLFMADPKKVVRKALRDSMMGKTVSVYGVSMKAFAVLCKILPHDLILRIYRP
ncbi:MAG: SDR family NAD(P)-dependent oxidoreductase [Brotaphodocola sp.]